MTRLPPLALALAPIVAAPLALAPVAASAYIGPGAGISAIGTALALVAALGLAIVGFVWYPIKRLFKLRRRRETQATAPEQPKP
jgi:hypothetical protein